MYVRTAIAAPDARNSRDAGHRGQREVTPVLVAIPGSREGYDGMGVKRGTRPTVNLPRYILHVAPRSITYQYYYHYVTALCFLFPGVIHHAYT